VGLEVLVLLRAGVPRAAVVKLFGDLFAGDVRGFVSSASRLARNVAGFDGDRLAQRVLDDLKETLLLEVLLLEAKGVQAPDALGARDRLADLLARAKRARLTKEASVLKKVVDRAKGEASAQEAFVALLAAGADGDPAARRSFLKKHGTTPLGRFAAGVLWGP
jgi:hypothetical protein